MTRQLVVTVFGGKDARKNPDLDAVQALVVGHLEKVQRDSGNVVDRRDDEKIIEYHSIPFGMKNHFFAFQFRTFPGGGRVVQVLISGW